jgi:hypothetical protein
MLLPGSEFTITNVVENKTGAKGAPPATHWYEIFAVQSDSAAMQASPDKDEAGKPSTTAAGTVLPEDPIGQVALSEAQRTIEDAEKVEKKITPALLAVANANGGKMAGLENKFKTEPSLARKLADRARTRVQSGDVGAAIQAELAKIWDALRYTVIVPEKRYKTFADKTLPDGLKTTAAVRLNYWNAWAESETYKGINQGYVLNTADKPPRQVRFEVQVHTGASYKTKSDIHGMYEEARAADTSPERRRELDKAMGKKWKKVPVPAGITSK